MKKDKKKFLISTVIVFFFVIVFQIIKYLITKSQNLPFNIGKINIIFIKNTGTAFSIASGNLFSISILNLVVILLIFRFMYVQEKNIKFPMRIFLIMMLSGGISNLIDRFFRGGVIDYIDISKIFNFPVFNLEDVILVIGWICFAFIVAKESTTFFRDNRKKREEDNK